MTRFLFVFAGLVLFSLGHANAAGTLTGKRPNFVFLLTDDQGYGDLSCHGNPLLKTPNMDRLGAEGVRLDNFHVSSLCSPSRGMSR